MILGIDTSAYTTSLAAVKTDRIEPVFDYRLALSVPHGERGLRQSEAVFQHLRNLEKLAETFQPGKIEAISVSSAPRPKPDSYMPVFKVGLATAGLLARALQVPMYTFSHQEGHLAAGLWSTNRTDVDQEVLAIHISGGTSDVLEVDGPFENMKITELGCSEDLHAGQFVDRVGVRLGLQFPAGRTMDELAGQSGELTARLPSSARGYSMSFSGPETAALRFIESGVSKEKISKMVFLSIARTLEKVIRYACSQKDYSLVLIVGGVACNSIIKAELLARMPLNILFCDKKYSSDNAVGTALLGLKKHLNRRKNNDY